MSKIPDWHSLSADEKNKLITKTLTFFDEWCTVVSGSDYDLSRRQLVDHIVETDFMKVDAPNVLDYWINYSKNLKGFDTNSKRWNKILWLDVIYMLINYYPQLQLHTTIKMVMINNYVDLMEV